MSCAVASSVYFACQYGYAGEVQVAYLFQLISSIRLLYGDGCANRVSAHLLPCEEIRLAIMYRIVWADRGLSPLAGYFVMIMGGVNLLDYLASVPVDLANLNAAFTGNRDADFEIVGRAIEDLYGEDGECDFRSLLAQLMSHYTYQEGMQIILSGSPGPFYAWSRELRRLRGLLCQAPPLNWFALT